MIDSVKFFIGRNVTVCQTWEKQIQVPYLDYLIIKSLQHTDLKLKLQIVQMLAQKIVVDIIPDDLLNMTTEQEQNLLAQCRQQEKLLNKQSSETEDYFLID